MSTRFKMGKVEPNAYRAMDALDTYIGNCDVTPLHQELIRIRASQLNGCAYCVNTHTQDALKAGESGARINLISVWREATNVFTPEEQLILKMTEEITLIHQHGLSDHTYEKAMSIFGKEKTAQLMMVIIGINAWNRIGVGLKMEPELSVNA
jgi:AhpD family alkylhydroperoxidase